ncbi:MAG TPA: response regulator transcription factor [Opitutaceae bacterium]|jgi:two-component system KDP operon response regulator KdpE|nr:response regulator transcription factor [Opitutaceae bacterium]
MTEDLRSSLLVVDDEEALLAVMRVTLEAAGYRVREATQGRAALGEVALSSPDAIILDLKLPDLSGVEVLRALRSICRTPVLVLSVLKDEATKVAALDAGADDYITKPFGREELLARLRTLLRRANAVASDRPLRFGPLEVDLATQWVGRQGRQIKLSATEFQLLRLLVVNADRIVTHRTILAELWGPRAEGRVHYVRTYMAKLRLKLGEEFDAAGYLQSESGIGYRLVSRPGEAGEARP